MSLILSARAARRHSAFRRRFIRELTVQKRRRVREAPRAALFEAALFTVQLSACTGMDVTRATGEIAAAGPREPLVDAAAPGDALQPAAPAVGEVPADAEASMRPSGSSLDAGVSPSPEPIDCSNLPAPPVAFEALAGFTASEDFAFDALGNYVGVDDGENLVRVSKDGVKQLWSPALGAVAGMALLPDGSIIFADIEKGSLKRVYPNGSVSVVLGGLAYPNGLDIGHDGFVYLAENNGGRVRRVNPDTGEFSVVALGLNGPNGVAFSNDPSLLYVGSFNGSGIYELKLKAPGQLGEARVFARPNGSTLAEPVVPCAGQMEGSPCAAEHFMSGRCQTLANVIDCLPVDPCPELADGSLCDHPTAGVCRAGRCVEWVNSCAGARAGDPCEDISSEAGTCQGSDGDLYCAPPNSCEGRRAGDTCRDPFAGPGFCEDFEGQLYCMPRPCEGRSAGDACEDPFAGPGSCVEHEGGLVCSIPNVCEGLPDGTPCDSFSESGVCEDGYCSLPALPGGIDGLGVDACGNVYATEYAYGIVWRISPDGQIERLADLPSAWIPNLKWGRGIGGFSKDVLYVADRQGSYLFALSVGVPGATEFFERPR